MSPENSASLLPKGESARRLKLLRKMMGLTQQEIARLLAVHHSLIGQIESGKREIKSDLALSLYFLTDTAWTWLMDAKGQADAPIDLFGAPLTAATIKKNVALNRPLKAPSKGDSDAIASALLEWTFAFSAAVRAGKLQVAILNSFRACGALFRIADLEELRESYGFILETRIPRDSENDPIILKNSSRREKLRNELEHLLSPSILLEIGRVLDNDGQITPYIGKLNAAIAALHELKCLRRTVPPYDWRAEHTKTRLRSIRRSNENSSPAIVD